MTPTMTHPVRPLEPWEQAKPKPERWLSLAEAAEYLNVKPNSLRKAIQRGRLRPARISGKKVLVQWQSVQEYRATAGQVRSASQHERYAREWVERRYNQAIAAVQEALADTQSRHWLLHPLTDPELAHPTTLEQVNRDVLTLGAALLLAEKRKAWVIEQVQKHDPLGRDYPEVPEQ